MRKIGDIHTFEDEAFLKRIYRMSLAVMAAGIVVAALWYAGFGALGRWVDVEVVPFEACAFGGLVGMVTGLGTSSLASEVAWGASLVVAILLSLVVHELVHAFFFKQFAPLGSRVTFGANWKLGMVYASAEGIVYTRQQYTVIALAPTFVVTFVLLAVGIGLKWPLWAILVATAHLSGCTGDWAYVRAIRQNPEITHCEDTAWGVLFYGEGAPAGFEAVDGGSDAAGGADADATGGADPAGPAASSASSSAETAAPAESTASAKGFSVVKGGKSA